MSKCKTCKSYIKEDVLYANRVVEYCTYINMISDCEDYKKFDEIYKKWFKKDSNCPYFEQQKSALEVQP